jgi:dihydropyrimidinase
VSAAYDAAVVGGTLVSGEGQTQATIAIRDGKIAALFAPGTAVDATETIDANGKHILPGVIDTHMHWGYKGDWVEQCQGDSRSAAIGGVTTAHVMHRFQPGQYHDLKALAIENTHIDFMLTPVVFDDATAEFIEEAIEDWGSPSWKFYLAYRNRPDAPPGDDWNQLTDGLLVDSLERLAAYEGVLALAHAENDEICTRAINRITASGRDDLEAWEDGHPGVSEAEAVIRIGLFAEYAGVPLLVVHMGGRDSLLGLERAKAHWPQTYGETCPHYLFHTSSTPDRKVKFSPPVRQQEDVDAMWEALASGLVDVVGADNASTTAAAKEGTIWDIPRGGPGSGTILPLILGEGVNKGRISLERAVEVTSSNAARIFGLYPQKGALHVGSDADLAIVDLGLTKTVTTELMQTWSDYNLYEGSELTGWPVVTMLRGEVIVRDFELQVGPGFGSFVHRSATRRATA